MLNDNALRYKAIPYRAQWADSQLGIGNQFVPDGIITGDLSVMRTGIGTGGMVRFLRPFKGDIIAAKLTMNGVTPATGFGELRFYKGTMNADGISLGTTPSNAQIAADWLKITGNSSAWFYGTQDNVFVDGLNILPLIPKRGDADFNEDFFVIGIDLFLKDGGSDWHCYDFKIDCNVRMAKP